MVYAMDKPFPVFKSKNPVFKYLGPPGIVSVKMFSWRICYLASDVKS